MQTVRNIDNEHVQPMGIKDGVIGFVEEVNGLGAQEIPGFVPTRHELLLLTHHWEKKAIGIEMFWFTYGQVGSSDMRIQPYARLPVNRIMDLLGDEVNEAIGRAEAEVKQEVGEETWQRLVNGEIEGPLQAPCKQRLLLRL